MFLTSPGFPQWA